MGGTSRYGHASALLGGREDAARVLGGAGRARERRVTAEGWVQPWVEKDAGGTMLMVCRARLHKMPDRTVFDKVEAGPGFQKYGGPIPRPAAVWLADDDGAYFGSGGPSPAPTPPSAPAATAGPGAAQTSAALGRGVPSGGGTQVAHADGAERRPFLGDLAVATWNSHGLLCHELVRARRKQALLSLLRSLDVLVVQEAHCGDLAYLEMERAAGATHASFCQGQLVLCNPLSYHDSPSWFYG